MVQIRWLGAAGLEIKNDNHALLIDPYFTRIGKRQIFFGRPNPDNNSVKRYLADMPETLAGIIITHTHFDHAMDAPAFASHTKCPVLGSQSLAALLNINGIYDRVTVCENQAPHELAGNTRVWMLPSRHGRVLFGRVPYPGEIIMTPARLPLRARDYRLGRVYAPLMEVGGSTFMHVGSANFRADAVSEYRCDVLFLCVPGWRSVPGYPEQLIDIVQPKVIIPFHFDDFSVPIKAGGKISRLPFLDMKGFLDRIYNRFPRIEIRMPEIFQPMVFD